MQVPKRKAGFDGGRESKDTHHEAAGTRKEATRQHPHSEYKQEMIFVCAAQICGVDQHTWTAALSLGLFTFPWLDDEKEELSDKLPVLLPVVLRDVSSFSSW